MPLKKLGYLLIGFGFAWIALWATFGALWGVWLNAQGDSLLQAFDKHFLFQKAVFTSAHAHMNAMAMTVILAGLGLFKLRGIPPRFLKLTAWCHVVSLPLFGFGLIAEGLWATARGQLGWAGGLSGAGGILYILAMAAWAACFFTVSTKGFRAARSRDEHPQNNNSLNKE